MTVDQNTVSAASDVVDPMENVAPVVQAAPQQVVGQPVVKQEPIVQPSKGSFSESSKVAANEIYRTEKERNASMAQGSQFINNNIK